MAESVHLFLKSNGSDVKGDSTQTSLGRDGSIECVSYSHTVSTSADPRTNRPNGRREYSPISIRKHVDRASPLLVKALVNNEKIDGTFKFYRPSATGDGTTEQYYTVDIKEGYVIGITQISPKSNAHMEAMFEDVEFSFKSITWTITNGGVSHQDTWGQNS